MKRKALLVGLNNFAQISGLRGCHADVTNWRSILKTYYGFSNHDIRVVLDSRATRDEVISRLSWLQDGSKPGDKLFLQFSSHGTQIRDRDGDERLKDNLDECICLYDMSWNSGYWLDDELQSFLESLHDDTLCEVIIDTCHSGVSNTTSPSYIELKEKGRNTNIAGRYVQPPLDILMRSEGESLFSKRFTTGLEALKNRERVQVVNDTKKEAPDYVVWSGCKENQTAADANIPNKGFNGAFSYYTCKHIRASNGDISRKDLIKRVCNSLSHYGYTQIPELTCHPDVASKGFLE